MRTACGPLCLWFWLRAIQCSIQQCNVCSTGNSDCSQIAGACSGSLGVRGRRRLPWSLQRCVSEESQSAEAPPSSREDRFRPRPLPGQALAQEPAPKRSPLCVLFPRPHRTRPPNPFASTMSLVSGPGRGMTAMPAEMQLYVDRHVRYIQSLDTVRLPDPARRLHMRTVGLR